MSRGESLRHLGKVVGDSIGKGRFPGAIKGEIWGRNEFIGYGLITRTTATILALLDSDFKMVDSIDNSDGWLFLDRTPLYAESGGQIGDRGRRFWGEGLKVVLVPKNF